ncbi:NADP-dependent 3-hydroxy acid dehydrogenase YdfG [Actinacidiphila yanglinensis]|uniref:NADP-dependent 3-hydroxy acid dehydrogenase YdfG n=1 Tax=Actinacidiphila yanglinensis TaxID=310779 RepID=A0A1H6A9D3_9ACTN|nr:SDR family oxidoreductase [Actinacidiphila yanglinensis]SEG45308.1 NADP-dependent 3-hydroxy acid dehydrogenase YdfG [Actinacidiphila yanglinensis]
MDETDGTDSTVGGSGPEGAGRANGAPAGGAHGAAGGEATGGDGGGVPADRTGRARVRERFVTGAGGVRLCVAEHGVPDLPGSAPTLVLVHGYPDSKEVWSAVAEQLSDRFHVVSYDVRGHGRSDAPQPLRGGFTLEKLTQDFLAVADAVSPDRPVHLVGHDWGSVQGWEFATQPSTEGRIASFTSISGPSLDHFGHWINRRVRRPTPRRAAQLLGQGAKSWYVYALHTPVLPELAWRGPLGRQWPKMLARAEKVPSDGYPTASLPQDAAHGAWLYRDNVRQRLGHPRPDPTSHVPVLLITPTRDAFLSERLYDDLDRWVPRLTRRTLPAKHWVPRSRPDQLVRWIADFVGATEGGDTAEPDPDAVRTVLGRGLPAARERFAGQLVVVTGAASGIGKATALAFAEAGARVVAVDRDAEGAGSTAAAARRAGAADAWPEVVDVADADAMEKFAARTADLRGVPDVVVNNAGIGLAGSFLDTTPEDWKQVLDVNLWGVIHGCRLFGRQMAERGQGGHIVNTASAAAFQPSRALPAYSTSKAAVLMLSECLRAELAPHGIGVSAICPGLVNTAITGSARHAGVSDEEQERRRARSSQLYSLRNYPPEKVARAVLRAVRRDTAVVPVTPEARGARLLSRLSPGALRALARVDPPL